MKASSQEMMLCGDFDTYVTLLNERCPIEYRDSWAATSFVADGDTVRVELLTPASLAGFLSMLIGDGDNVKRMWVNQLKVFGNPWAELFNRSVEAQRPLVITIKPKDSRTSGEIVYTPEDLAAMSDILGTPSSKP